MRGSEKPPCVRIYADNQGSIDRGKNQAINQRNKHAHVEYHYVGDIAAAGKVEFVYCPREEMIADIFTKRLDRVEFEKHVLSLGVSTQSWEPDRGGVSKPVLQKEISGHELQV